MSGLWRWYGVILHNLLLSPVVVWCEYLLLPYLVYDYFRDKRKKKQMFVLKPVKNL